MSNKYTPFYHRHPEGRPVGALAGWDKITTQTADGTTPSGDHEFTAADLLKVVRAFRAEFNLQRLDEIEMLIRKHMARTDNPHKLDLADLETSVLQELYKLWISTGATGTREDFLKVIFQYVRIADIPTTRLGKAYDQVVSAAGLAAVVKDHDESEDAHEAIWLKLFPGEELRTTPTFAMHAYLGLPHTAIVTRPSPMWVLTDTGIIKKIPENTLEADHGTGEAAFPLFDALTNYIEESEDFSDGVYVPKNAEVVRNAGIASMDEAASAAYVLQEKFSAVPLRHELRYYNESINIIQGQYYTISIFVRPNGRDCFGIEILDLLSGAGSFGFAGSGLLPFDQGTFRQLSAAAYRNVHFKCSTEQVFINSKAQDLFGYIYPCYNGWYRLQVTFKALSTVPMQISMYTIDIHDGDDTCEGIAGQGLALFGLEFTDGPFLPPYIPSRDHVMGSIAATTVQIPMGDDDWFTNKNGTFVTEVSNIGIDCQLVRACEMYNLADALTNVTAIARFPKGHNNRAYFAGYTAANAVARSGWSPASKKRWVQAIHGYTTEKHLFAGPLAASESNVPTPAPLNPNAKTLYLGCSRYLRDQLNGYIRSLIYYPEIITPKATHFFFGE